MRALVLFSCCIALPLAAAAEVYSWRDADGKMHYSDQPPAGADVAVKRRPPPPAAPAEGAAAPAKPLSYAEKELEFRKRRADAAEAEAKAREEAEHKRALERDCQSARSNLSGLNSGQRMARFNAKGEREFLDDAARANETRRLEKYIAKNCGK